MSADPRPHVFDDARYPTAIFVAHRDHSAIEVLRSQLKQIGRKVAFTTDSGHQLLSEIRRQSPDIAIVGTGLHDMDTIDLLNEISLQSDTCAIAIVPTNMLDRFESDMIDRVMGALVEPPHAQQLRSAIYVALNRHRDASRLSRRIHELEDQVYPCCDSVDGRHHGCDDQTVAAKAAADDASDA